MRQRPRATVTELRQAIDCLPLHTRRAMLEGISSNQIVVGAYTHDDGICPMLAAHRHGGRTTFAAFAHAWDRLAYRDTSRRGRRARRATERELLILRTQLEASLIQDAGPAADFAEAIREHAATRPAPQPTPAPPERDHRRSDPGRLLARLEAFPWIVRRRASTRRERTPTAV